MYCICVVGMGYKIQVQKRIFMVFWKFQVKLRTFLLFCMQKYNMVFLISFPSTPADHSAPELQYPLVPPAGCAYPRGKSWPLCLLIQCPWRPSQNGWGEQTHLQIHAGTSLGRSAWEGQPFQPRTSPERKLSLLWKKHILNSSAHLAKDDEHSRFEPSLANEVVLLVPPSPGLVRGLLARVKPRVRHIPIGCQEAQGLESLCIDPHGEICHVWYCQQYQALEEVVLVLVGGQEGDKATHRVAHDEQGLALSFLKL